MESLLNRYRNITVLLLVIMAQLVLLAVSAKNDQDVRFIRVWTVTAVTPVARIIEGLRGGSTGFLHNYILLHDTNQENQRLRAELDRLKMENVFLKNELNTADRAKALQVFQQHTPSKTLAATHHRHRRRVELQSGVRGSRHGVGRAARYGGGHARWHRGQGDRGVSHRQPGAADYRSRFRRRSGHRKIQVHGTLKGQGTPQCKVDYVPFEEKVEPGEMVYTSGDDRIFPRGFPVGVVKAVRPGQPFKEILVEPSGMQHGLEDVLILTEGVHQRIPDAPSGMQPVYIAPAPPGSESAAPADAAVPASLGTEADRLRTQYKALGEEQNHKYGDNPPGTKPVDFTKLGKDAPAAQAPAPAKNPASPAGTPPGSRDREARQFRSCAAAATRIRTPKRQARRQVPGPEAPRPRPETRRSDRRHTAQSRHQKDRRAGRLRPEALRPQPRDPPLRLRAHHQSRHQKEQPHTAGGAGCHARRAAQASHRRPFPRPCQEPASARRRGRRRILPMPYDA